MARRERDSEIVGSRMPVPFAGTVGRIAALEGVSKSTLIRRALLAYLLPGGR